jgi:hypothetical protein
MKKRRTGQGHWQSLVSRELARHARFNVLKIFSIMPVLKNSKDGFTNLHQSIDVEAVNSKFVFLQEVL